MAQGSSNPTTDLKKVNGTAVDVNTGNASAGTQRVVLASDQPVVAVSDNGGSLTVDVGTALPAGTNAIGKLAANSGVDIGDVDILSIVPGTGATNLGKAEDAIHNAGDVGVMALGRRIDTAAAASGSSGDYEPMNMSAEGAQWGTLTPTTTSGLSIARDIDLDNGALTVVKASAGNLYGYYLYNTSASTVYVKFYNATSGTLGTGTPVMTIPLPVGGGANVGFPYPVSFSTGICVGAGTGVGDADNTDPGANAVIANIFYK